MKSTGGGLSVSPTDLANFLACAHKTSLDLLAAYHQLQVPTWSDPLADVLRARGMEHEAAYVGTLLAAGLSVRDFVDAPLEPEPSAAVMSAMRDGLDVLVQVPLAADGWTGRADILRRVEKPSALGAWSYEVQDTKLSSETRGGSILQLCVYSELLGKMQECAPDCFHVVTPEGRRVFRLNDVVAYYRVVKAKFLAFIAQRGPSVEVATTYPEPCDHCQVCRWWERCNAHRRQDDHISFCANLGRVHQSELIERGVETLARLATMPLPLTPRPKRGASESYDRLQDQARLQVLQRTTGQPTYDLLPIEPQRGLCSLPTPRPGDLFLDLEGDPFARDTAATTAFTGGREYLFGLGHVDADGAFIYEGRWAFDDETERAGFEAVVDRMLAAVEEDPEVHVYHYAPYEPSAMKRLMGRYATREEEVDRLLRGERFVDLFAVVRQSLRAGVESYSLKRMEPFYGFVRDVDLSLAGDARRVVELALESGDYDAVADGVRASVAGYNRDDCRSTLELRNWLESLRAAEISLGAAIPRLEVKTGDANQDVSERQKRIETLRARLLDETHDDRSSRRLLAYLLDWQYREEKSTWWEFHRLRTLSPEEFADDPAVLSGLVLVDRLGPVLSAKTARPTGSVIDRYAFQHQEVDISRGDKLKHFVDGRPFGTVEALDRVALTVDVKKGASAKDVHAAAVFAHDAPPNDGPAKSIFRIGEYVVAHGAAQGSQYRAGLALLRGDSPHVGGRMMSDVPRLAGESVTDYAVRVAPDLVDTVLPIQGPPGAGKTFTGARMICAMATSGRRVAVTGPSHKVIRNLLDAVLVAAADVKVHVKVGQRVNDDCELSPSDVVEFDDNTKALKALESRTVQVLGGTAWLWSTEAAIDSADVMFVDEAGQLSLAHTLAVSASAKTLVLLGDPQQLEQPQKGVHPDGIGVSALQHVLGIHETMPADRGLFLPVTWRLAPAICDFTSEQFYEGKLVAKAGLDRQQIAGPTRFSGAGLFVAEVEHSGCRNASDEEAQTVSGIVDELLSTGVLWIDERGTQRPLTPRDILVVAPYNAHVSRLQAVLSSRGVRAGTVDKFQGQEAPVVIYSMATSAPADAPRGLEFLYSRHRLNVATSRARAICVLVASPRLFEPECRTPRQMHLANALCRYRELAAR